MVVLISACAKEFIKNLLQLPSRDGGRLTVILLNFYDLPLKRGFM